MILHHLPIMNKGDFCMSLENRLYYDVVINQEKQYSLWLHKKPIPKGWSCVQHQLTQSEALDYIKQHWLDLCPATVRASNN